MKPSDDFDALTVEQCHMPLKAKVAWLRMVYRHIAGAMDSLRDKKSSDRDRVDNALNDVANAMTYIEDEIYRSTQGEE